MDFNGIKRNLLQALCKELDIHANMKNMQMVDALNMFFKGKDFGTFLTCVSNTKVKRHLLQALCKRHDIPANMTNTEMIRRLTLLFEGNSDTGGCAHDTTVDSNLAFAIDSVGVENESKNVKGRDTVGSVESEGGLRTSQSALPLDCTNSGNPESHKIRKASFASDDLKYRDDIAGINNNNNNGTLYGGMVDITMGSKVDMEDGVPCTENNNNGNCLIEGVRGSTWQKPLEVYKRCGKAGSKAKTSNLLDSNEGSQTQNSDQRSTDEKPMVRVDMESEKSAVEPVGELHLSRTILRDTTQTPYSSPAYQFGFEVQAQCALAGGLSVNHIATNFDDSALLEDRLLADGLVAVDKLFNNGDSYCSMGDKNKPKELEIVDGDQDSQEDKENRKGACEVGYIISIPAEITSLLEEQQIDVGGVQEPAGNELESGTMPVVLETDGDCQNTSSCGFSSGSKIESTTKDQPVSFAASTADPHFGLSMDASAHLNECQLEESLYSQRTYMFHEEQNALQPIISHMESVAVEDIIFTYQPKCEGQTSNLLELNEQSETDSLIVESISQSGCVPDDQSANGVIASVPDDHKSIDRIVIFQVDMGSRKPAEAAAETVGEMQLTRTVPSDTTLTPLDSSPVKQVGNEVEAQCSLAGGININVNGTSFDDIALRESQDTDGQVAEAKLSEIAIVIEGSEEKYEDEFSCGERSKVADKGIDKSSNFDEDALPELRKTDGQVAVDKYWNEGFVNASEDDLEAQMLCAVAEDVHKDNENGSNLVLTDGLVVDDDKFSNETIANAREESKENCEHKSPITFGDIVVDELESGTVPVVLESDGDIQNSSSCGFSCGHDEYELGEVNRNVVRTIFDDRAHVTEDSEENYETDQVADGEYLNEGLVKANETTKKKCEPAPEKTEERCEHKSTKGSRSLITLADRIMDEGESGMMLVVVKSADDAETSSPCGFPCGSDEYEVGYLYCSKGDEKKLEEKEIVDEYIGNECFDMIATVLEYEENKEGVHDVGELLDAMHDLSVDKNESSKDHSEELLNIQKGVSGEDLGETSDEQMDVNCIENAMDPGNSKKIFKKCDEVGAAIPQVVAGDLGEYNPQEIEEDVKLKYAQEIGIHCPPCFTVTDYSAHGITGIGGEADLKKSIGVFTAPIQKNMDAFIPRVPKSCITVSDMKENLHGRTIEKVTNRTSVKPMHNRRALEDLTNK